MKHDDVMNIRQNQLEIVSDLGSGHYGSVKLAKFQAGGKFYRVAVKTLKPHLISQVIVCLIICINDIIVSITNFWFVCCFSEPWLNGIIFRTKLSYMERLSLLKLDLLEIRRIKSDLKMCYKIINGLCDIDLLHYINFAVTRGHNIRLIKPICSTNCQLYFFTNRVVNYWNFLPADIVNASSFGIFVHKLNLPDLSGLCRGGRA